MPLRLSGGQGERGKAPNPGEGTLRYFNEITLFENRRRVRLLQDFRNTIIDYFNNSHVDYNFNRVESKIAQAARVKINHLMKEAHALMIAAGVIPVVRWSPPPALGGYIKNIDSISDVFHLHRHQMDARVALDFLDRSIGVCDSDYKRARIRTLNPFFYFWLFLDWISLIPFKFLGQFGFDGEKLERSTFGGLFKGTIKVVCGFIGTFAAVLQILKHIDYLEPAKAFVLQTLSRF